MSGKRRDPILERQAELAAEQVVSGIAALPVDPFAIAASRDILVRAETLDTCSGCLVRSGGNFGILYSDKFDNAGFERFTVAHELGHYFIPGHPEKLFKNGDGCHQSQSGFVSVDAIERQADHFAATLLMPPRLFREAMRRERAEGFEAIEAMSGLCGTSLTAAARRFAEFSDDPVAVILSKGGAIEWFTMSEPLRRLRGLTWPKKGSPLPRGSATAQFNRDELNVSNCLREESTSCLSDWFDGPHDFEMNEDVVGLGRYGRTLTVLFSGDALPDEDDDHEED